MAPNDRSVVLRLQLVLAAKERRECPFDIDDLIFSSSLLVFLFGPFTQVVAVRLGIRVIVQTEPAIEGETQQVIEGGPEACLFVLQRMECGSDLQVDAVKSIGSSGFLKAAESVKTRSGVGVRYRIALTWSSSRMPLAIS